MMQSFRSAGGLQRFSVFLAIKNHIVPSHKKHTALVTHIHVSAQWRGGRPQPAQLPEFNGKLFARLQSYNVTSPLRVHLNWRNASGSANRRQVEEPPDRLEEGKAAAQHSQARHRNFWCRG